MRYAIMINGVTELSMMKADILSIFDEIKVCTHYIINGEKVLDFPFDVNDLEIEPVYLSLPGWKTNLTELRSYANAPKELKDYVTYLEKELNVPINVVSVGPDREQTLLK
jgi:adenylosuccinate synthase